MNIKNEDKTWELIESSPKISEENKAFLEEIVTGTLPLDPNDPANLTRYLKTIYELRSDPNFTQEDQELILQLPRRALGVIESNPDLLLELDSSLIRLMQGPSDQAIILPKMIWKGMVKPEFDSSPSLASASSPPPSDPSVPHVVKRDGVDWIYLDNSWIPLNFNEEKPEYKGPRAWGHKWLQQVKVSIVVDRAPMEFTFYNGNSKEGPWFRFNGFYDINCDNKVPLKKFPIEIKADTTLTICVPERKEPEQWWILKACSPYRTSDASIFGSFNSGRPPL